MSHRLMRELVYSDRECVPIGAMRGQPGSRWIIGRSVFMLRTYKGDNRQRCCPAKNAWRSFAQTGDALTTSIETWRTVRPGGEGRVGFR
jgi:hypothetical protein